VFTNFEYIKYHANRKSYYLFLAKYIYLENVTGSSPSSINNNHDNIKCYDFYYGSRLSALFKIKSHPAHKDFEI